jgi:hypothetical protein
LKTYGDRPIDIFSVAVSASLGEYAATPRFVAGGKVDGPRFLAVGVKSQDFELVLWPGTPGTAR